MYERQTRRTMPDTAHVIAGRCTAVFEGDRTREHCGDLVALLKPDSSKHD